MYRMYRLDMIVLLLIVLLFNEVNSIQQQIFQYHISEQISINKVDNNIDQSNKLININQPIHNYLQTNNNYIQANNQTQLTNNQTNQFRFQHSLTIPASFTTLQHINILNNNSIALSGLINQYQKQINLFNSPNYQTIINSINTTNQATITYSSNQIYINQLSSIKQYSQSQSLQDFLNTSNIYRTQNNQIPINQEASIDIINLPIQIPASKYGLKSIIVIDANNDNMLAFAGQAIESTQTNLLQKIVVLDQQKNTILQTTFAIFNSTNKIGIALNQNNQRLALCYKYDLQTYKFQLWNLIKKQKTFDVQIGGQIIKSINFMNLNKIIISIDQYYSLLDFNSYKYKLVQMLTFPLCLFFSINKNGSLIAFVIDNSTVDIYDTTNQQNKVSHIKVKTNKIADLVFNDNNTLYIADTQSNIFIFSNNKCPNTFFNNNQSYCQCRNYSTLSNQTCTCNQNFYDQSNESCACVNPFIMNGDNCQCPANTTQLINQCACNENFIRNNENCICPQSFLFDNERCNCVSGKYKAQKTCEDCSFWCIECSGTGFQCQSFSVGFYLIVIGGGIIIISGLIVIGVILYRKKLLKRKRQKQLNRIKQNEQTSQRQNNSDLLIDESMRIPLKNKL